MKTLIEIVQDLKLHYPNLSDYELLSIAVQLQRNYLLSVSSIPGGSKNLNYFIEDARKCDREISD